MRRKILASVLVTAGVTAGLIAPVTARAQGPGTGIWALQDENASISSQNPTDRDYVNGFRLNWTSPRGDVPDVLAGLGHAVWGDGTQRISLGVTQKIYTPTDTGVTNPPLGDEPYAGYLAATIGLIQDTANTRSVLAVSAGVIGRDAGAEIVQNGFHSVIGQRGTHGWAYQLPSEPALDLLASRTWRVPMGHLGAMSVEALPQLAAMIGTTEIYAQPALTLRIGQGLGSDFGAPMLRPGPSGSTAYRATRPLAWYVFAGVAGKLVGHDEFLQGADFQASRRVRPYRAVGQIDVGAAMLWRGLRFSYTQVFQTRRYYGEVGSIHEYGSFAVSGRF